MAELSTLSPSPPALGDPHAAPSIPLSSSALPATNNPAPDSAREIHIPKSSLYNDKALTGNTPSALSGGSPLTPHPPLSPPKLIAETTLTLLVHEAAPQREESAGKDGEPGGHVVKQETMTGDPAAAELLNTETPALSSEPSAPSEVQQASPSPDLNPGPNLYPNVHVTHNPNPIMDDGQFTADQPQAAAASNPTPDPPESTDMAASALAEEETPQPLQQAQNPQSQPPLLSPKPDTTSEARKEELPSTPTRAEHPSPTVPLIHEPASAFSLPNPRQALDTLSYLESASLMSGTLESLSGLGEDGSSVGSDSEINGLTVRRTDKYGFLGGTQYSDVGEKEVRVEVARQREVKWLDMFHNWDKWIKHRFQKVKLRCRKGIPSSLRAKAWQLLSNSQELLDANPGKFEELEREQGEAKWLDIIEKDLHRQFPFHEMFAARGGHGQQDLYRILKAYTIYRPDEGYCQAQAPVAAVLLMHMPAEQAFWCLVQICEKYLPGYYSAGLEAIQLDGEIFFSLLRRTCPMAYRHLKKFKIDPILYMTEWFMCIFSRTLPWASVLRVWDMFFCEGVKIVFRVGLVLLKQMLGSVDKLRELQGMYETMERLRNISPDTFREDILVQEIITLPVTEALIERECSVQVRKWKESRGELTHQPGRRLHGTRAIFEYKRRAASISSGGSFSFLGSPIPPPGPLRASSSLLSLPGFRKSRTPFHSHPKKGSFSGPSGMEGLQHQSPPAVTSSPGRGTSHKPPIPPGAGQRAPPPHTQSPLVAQASEVTSAQGQPTASAPIQSTSPPPSTLSPSPKIVSEQITPTIPSPTANNAPLPPFPDSKKEVAPVADATAVEEEGKKKKSKDKKKEKEDEKKKLKEKKEKEKAEKEGLRKEKERLEKEKKKGGKKKDKGRGEAEDKNGATAARDSA
ncbi:TBC1 domain family member 10A-like [Siniperca chuatsi]|uniref:TBC1 domain family member 10A-like n=1 Tax=Siniperca chuatsi TaxID=119488 RepID=UPI001CE1F9A2|nr:TBC1 domain family member 10A-like [Siniperca chuatsi]XP_044037025.1 TBC1 domain family member 10A-like [Siniperca chuatsi]